MLMMMGSMKSSRLSLVQLQRAAVAGGLALLIAAALIGPAVSAENVEFDGSSYARNVSLDNVNIFWTIDTEIDTIRLALHAKVEGSAELGWAGVGISEMGGMEGADIAVYETSVRFFSFIRSGSGGGGSSGSEKTLCLAGKLQ